MNPNSNRQPLSHNTEDFDPARSASTYAPSVPISVYRQLSAELQQAQHEIQTLRGWNQKLVEQNQLLRQETGEILKVAYRLQAVAEESPEPDHSYLPSSTQATDPYLHPEERTVPQPETMFHQPSRPLYPGRTEATPALQFDRTLEISGWWRVLTIVLIVVTAFGTGFLIVRSFLSR